MIATDNKNETAEWFPFIRRLNRKILVLEIVALLQSICILDFAIWRREATYALSKVAEILSRLVEILD